MKEGRKKVGMCFGFFCLFPLYAPPLGVSPIHINVGVVCLNCRFFLLSLSLFIWEDEYRHWYDRPVYKGGFTNLFSDKGREFDGLFEPSTTFKSCRTIREIVPPL